VRRTDSQFPEHKTIAIPCDCAGQCTYLVISRWDDAKGEDDEFYADLYQVPQTPNFRYRLRMALRALVGRPTYEPGMVIGVEQATELHRWLDERLYHVHTDDLRGDRDR
jgi:hypothetical protein